MNQTQPITLFEKIMTFINAKLTAVGITVGSIATAFWYMTSSISSGGLGLSIGGSTTAIAMITLIGVTTFLLAIPIAYLGYRDLISEAEILNQEIKQETHQYKKNQDKLFFELLRLRSFCNNNKIFINRISSIFKSIKHIINTDVMTSLIDLVYIELKYKRFIFRWNSTNHSHVFSDIFNDPQLLANPYVRQTIMKYINKHYSIQNCYRPIQHPADINRSKAAAYGVIAGLTIAGVLLGTGWTFPAMIIGVGLAASLPFIGWAVLGVSCIALGIIFGIGVGICKQKNLQREAIKNQIKTNNHLFIYAKEHINNTIVKQPTAITKLQQDYKPRLNLSESTSFKPGSSSRYGLLNPKSRTLQQPSVTPIEMMSPSP